MKGQRAALAAAVVVILLASAAATGTTYSWWSAENTTSMSIETPDMGISTSVEATAAGFAFNGDGEGTAVSDIAKGESGLLSVTVTNTGDVPVLYSADLVYTNYRAFTSGTGDDRQYLGEYILKDGSWSFSIGYTDASLTGYASTYNLANLRSISAGIGEDKAEPIYRPSGSDLNAGGGWSLSFASGTVPQVDDGSLPSSFKDSSWSVGQVIEYIYKQATSAKNVLILAGSSYTYSIYLAIGDGYDSTRTNSTIDIVGTAVQATQAATAAFTVSDDTRTATLSSVGSAYAVLGDAGYAYATLGPSAIAGVQEKDLTLTCTSDSTSRTLVFTSTEGSLSGKATFSVVLSVGDSLKSVTCTVSGATNYLPVTVSYGPSGIPTVTFVGDLSQSTTYTVSYTGGS